MAQVPGLPHQEIDEALLRRDYSTASLIAANVLVVAVAMWLGLRLKDLLLVYWAQSVLIGTSFLIRMIARIWQDREEWFSASVYTLIFGGFFVVHYGFFHFIYLMFLKGSVVLWSSVSACVLAFALHHGYSLWQHLRRDTGTRLDFAALLWLPYARILPMHMTLIVGQSAVDLAGISGGLVLFLALKTAADVAMHLVERGTLRFE